MEFERRSASSPVMNTNEIPIRLPERYASRRRQTRVIREDDINDELILERRREEYTSFFLSFVYEFRSVQRTAGKQNRTRHNGRVRRRSRADVPSLLRSPSSRAKTSERRPTASLVFARRTTTASVPTRSFRTHKTCVPQILH